MLMPLVTPAFRSQGPCRVLHFFTTRRGGVSRPPYDSLNLGFHVGDEPAAVLANRRRLCQAVGIPLSAWTCGEQVHGATVRVVGAEERGCGSLTHASALRGTDALVTAEPGICLVVLVADCVPLLFVDEARGVIAVAHAGWRGTVANIAGATVEVMASSFRCRRENIRVAIGPCIGSSDYAIGPEVATAIEAGLGTLAADVLATADGRHLTFDLRRTNLRQLTQAGIPRAAIEWWAVSTYRATDRYFSARAAGGPTGRFAGGLMLCP